MSLEYEVQRDVGHITGFFPEWGEWGEGTIRLYKQSETLQRQVRRSLRRDKHRLAIGGGAPLVIGHK
jgi:hypothetical protein